MSDQNREPTLGRLPRLSDPPRYQGLYILDFGDGVSVGYLAAEIATLHESNRFPEMQAYRIHRALPDGTLELVHVSLRHFSRKTEEGVFFLREDESQAREDFQSLQALAADRFPCPARLQLASVPDSDWPFVTALVYSMEYSDDVSDWLVRIDYRGGDTVEFGANRLGSFLAAQPKMLAEADLQPAAGTAARPLDELLATRQYAVQRQFG